MKILAAGVQDVIGTIKPPISTIPEEPAEAVGSLISLGIQLFIIVAGVTLLIVLLLGAYEWVVSGGDKEKLSKAQQKITNAVIGIIVVVVVLSVFCVVTVDILKLPIHVLVLRFPLYRPKKDGCELTLCRRPVD